MPLPHHPRDLKTNNTDSVKSGLKIGSSPSKPFQAGGSLRMRNFAELSPRVSLPVGAASGPGPKFSYPTNRPEVNVLQRPRKTPLVLEVSGLGDFGIGNP